MGSFPKGLKNEFETAVVDEPSVFEPLKFYCIYINESALYFMIPFSSFERDHSYVTRYNYHLKVCKNLCL